MIGRKKKAELYENVRPKLVMRLYDVSVHLNDDTVIEGTVKSCFEMPITDMYESGKTFNIKSKDGKSSILIPSHNIAYIEKTERHGVPVR